MNSQYMIFKYSYIFIRCFCWHESCGEFTELWSAPDKSTQVFRTLYSFCLAREVMPFLVLRAVLLTHSLGCGVESKFC